jgi:hypothetical protein
VVKSNFERTDCAQEWRDIFAASQGETLLKGPVACRFVCMDPVNLFRRWAEERGGVLACVRGTGGRGDTGV